jgi:glycosyltransferase involved in cell wall biosynthesis
MRQRDLGAALAALGVQVTHIVDDCPYNRTSLNLDPKTHVEYVPKPRQWSNIKSRREIIRRLRPDWVHILIPSPKTYLTMRGLDEVKVLGEWDEWRAAGDHSRFLDRLKFRFLDRWLRRRASRHVVASQFMQKQFAEHFGIDCAYIPHASFMQKYPDGVSPFTEPTMVYMGNFYSTYDHDIVFHAAKLLVDKGIRPRIEVIGQGPDFNKWQQYVAQHGLTNVTLPGYFLGEDIWRRLRHAHTLLFPIRWSVANACRCPGKIFMYMHARRPVTTCDVGETSVQFGELAKYVPCTPEAFAEAIAEAIKEPWPADVPYRLGTWEERARQLLKVVGYDPQQSAVATEALVQAQTH